ncbi:E3 ubiquitin-protein ligase TRIM35 [Osmerus eperlanus]|uniref:E3 ubiquitin-protein ligase TRIM35 n=1 Tax=Osmerus eperlanus TaxID=29151 RepID=UPI002E0F24EC
MSCGVSLPEEDLYCPVCIDIFSDPVLLTCSHSVCRSCIQRCWDTSASRECPVCRCRASKHSPPSNLALKNLCEALVQSRRESHAGRERLLCSLHGEQFKLFCLDDMQPVCVVCQSSKMHKHHECSPIEEAALDCKNEICASLKTLKDTLDSLTRVPNTLKTTLAHIKSQALETEQKMKDQFGQLHQFLYEEETAMLAGLREEEEEKRSLVMIAMTETAARTLSLTENIAVLEKEIAEDDMTLLQNFKATLERGSCVPQPSVTVSGTLVDVAKHLCNLKYRVWERMSHHVDKAPVILDPNTAHPCLILSDDLTSLHYSSLPLGVPDNPERFHMSAEVVGTTGLGSGSHCWEVETGSNEDWILGVVSESVPRAAEALARPENGFWTLCLRNKEYRAMTSPPTLLAVARKPQRVRVQMDWDKGEVSFFDSTDRDAALYSFSQTKFTERVFPYFYTQSKHPLRILNDEKQCFG